MVKNFCAEHWLVYKEKSVLGSNSRQNSLNILFSSLLRSKREKLSINSGLSFARCTTQANKKSQHRKLKRGPVSKEKT